MAEQEILEQEATGGNEPTPQVQQDELEKQVKGLLADLQKERERRHLAEEDLTSLKSRIEELESLIAELGQSSTEPDISEDEFTGSLPEVKTLVEKTVEEKSQALLSEIQSLRAQILSEKLAMSEEKAREKYSPEKVGEDLSYDKVLSAFEELAKSNPGYKQAVLAARDPAEEAYRLGLTHPKLRELLQKQAAGDVISKMTSPKPRTGVGSSKGGGGVSMGNASIDDLLKLSDEELDKLARQT